METMEASAKGEEDGCYNVKIRQHWLEVESLLDGTFRYRWGKNIVSREHAVNVLATRKERNRS